MLQQAPLIHGQLDEELPLGGPQGHLPSLQEQPPLVEIDGHVADHEKLPALLPDWSQPPQHRPNAGVELVEAARGGHVVVGSQL